MALGNRNYDESGFFQALDASHFLSLQWVLANYQENGARVKVDYHMTTIGVSTRIETKNL